MTLEEAVTMIDGAVAHLQLSRDGHVKVQEAIALIREACKPDGAND
jgi:hypothetical protein